MLGGNLAKMTSLPMVAYDMIQHWGRKPSVQLIGGGEGPSSQNNNMRIVLFLFLLILVVISLYYYNKRSYRFERSFGRKFWALFMIIFQTPIYFVYAALDLFIPTMDSTLPLPNTDKNA